MIEYSHTIKIFPNEGRSIEHLNQLDLSTFVQTLLLILYGSISDNELQQCLFREEAFGRNIKRAVVIDVDLSYHDFANIISEIQKLFNQFPLAIISRMEIVENRLPFPKGEDLLSHM